MTPSQREKIEVAAKKYSLEWRPDNPDSWETPIVRALVGVAHPAFIAGAEFALKMVDCNSCYNDGYLQGCNDTKIVNEQKCISKSAPSLETND